MFFLVKYILIMELIDTPNPNAKKIILDHKFDTAIYLNEELIEDDNLINLFKHPGVENIFSGPKFLTVTKKQNYSWEIILQDLDT